jgi:Domain of Unknown Function (DUF928)
MKRQFFGKNPITVGLALLLGCTIAGEPLVAIAQHYIPPKRGIPGRLEGAGTRGPKSVREPKTTGDSRCLQSTHSLTVLVPVDKFSTTVSTTPTFFWYLAETSAKTAEFRLLDEADQEVFMDTISLKAQPGIMSYVLPKRAAPYIASGKEYRWEFSLICDADRFSVNPLVEGVVQYIEPSIALTDATSKAKTFRDLAAVYAEQGIWHDALLTLAQQRCDRPNDLTLKMSWATLLRSVQLGELTQAPLTATCTALKNTTFNSQSEQP